MTAGYSYWLVSLLVTTRHRRRHRSVPSVRLYVAYADCPKKAGARALAWLPGATLSTVDRLTQPVVETVTHG